MITRVHDSPLHRFRYWKIDGGRYRYEMLIKVPAEGCWLSFFKVAGCELTGDALAEMADELWQLCIDRAAKGKAA